MVSDVARNLYWGGRNEARRDRDAKGPQTTQLDLRGPISKGREGMGGERKGRRVKRGRDGREGKGKRGRRRGWKRDGGRKREVLSPIT